MTLEPSTSPGVPAQLVREIDRCPPASQPRLRAKLRAIEQRLTDGKPADRNLARLREEVAALLAATGLPAPPAASAAARRDTHSGPHSAPRPPARPPRGPRRRDDAPRSAAGDHRTRSRRRRPSPEPPRTLPPVTFPEDLPIAQRRDEIAQAITQHQVVVVCGETGSGKTTQLPKICLALGRGAQGRIGHTQPRRIAARTVAARIASELNQPLGRTVGYQVRFGDVTGPDTAIKLMTDGILLAETQRDRLLQQYDTLIIDEAHERSLNIDFLLGYLKQLLPRRPDLKVIITSATIDPQRFSDHFAGAPIIEVSGRTYPVEVRYRPPVEPGEDADNEAIQQGIVDAAIELGREGPGDMLVFLSGEREIREAATALEAYRDPLGQTVEVLPLMARLTAAEQDRVFAPHQGRRIVLATNVAETSLTVPGIRFVIDTGLARISRYSSRRKVERLPIEPVSQASANQRMGRCGRVQAGICIRLYSEEDFASREPFTPPEILRTNLASVILQAAALGLGDVAAFPFVDPPKSAMIRDGYHTLHELGAVDEHGELTPVGRKLARLPIDPRIGRMILAAQDEHCMAEMLIIAAALSIMDPRERPLDKQADADAAHEQFKDPQSDYLTLLNLWRFYQEQSASLSRNRLRKCCRQNFLSAVRMREWQDVVDQLRAIVAEVGIGRGRRDQRGQSHQHGGASRPAPMRLNRPKAQASEAAAPAIHRALLAGLLGNIGFKSEKGHYIGAGGTSFYLFPGSALFSKGPKWVMAAELVETTRLYARMCAPIRPEWVEALASHLVKRTYQEPRWDRDRATVIADEKVTLYGLTIVAKRTVPYGPVDTLASRQMFIHHALVEGDYETAAPFFAHNRKLQEQIEREEAKLRKRDVLVPSHVRHAFYDKRIPPDVCDGPRFEAWRKQVEQDHPRLLFMSRTDLVHDDADRPSREHFPDQLQQAGTRLKLEYHLEPGHEADGVTATVPLGQLNQVDESKFEHLVPGMLHEKLVALIRSLPKELRKSFVPAPDVAARVAERLDPDKPLLQTLAEQLEALTGVAVPASAWRLDTLPEHLRMNFRVVDQRGKTLAMDRSLPALRQRLAPRVRDTLDQVSPAKWNRQGIRSWDFGNLPESVEVRRGGMTLKAYPAIEDQRDSVALRLFDKPEEAEAATQRGLTRLLLLELHTAVRSLITTLPHFDRVALLYVTLGSKDQFRSMLARALVHRAGVADLPPVRSPGAFAERIDLAWNRLGPTSEELWKITAQALPVYQKLALALQGQVPVSWQGVAYDLDQQLRELMPPDFLDRIEDPWLRQLPRYLQAMLARWEKLRSTGPARDAQRMATLLPWLKAYRARLEQHRQQGIDDPALRQFRWMLEELRVATFAQELGTSIPMSPKRLEKAWSRVRGSSTSA